MRDKIISGIIGYCVGDALGVPFEFVSRKVLKTNPTNDMIGHGSHDQPKGTWSDDSSMTFCLMDSLISGLDYEDISSKFLKWYEDSYWTPYGVVFDIGNTTMESLDRYKSGVKPVKAGGSYEKDNGNGSLMRILPLSFYLLNKDLKDRVKIIYNISSITHRHKRSLMACVFYVEYAMFLIKGFSLHDAFFRTVGTFNKLYCNIFNKNEYLHFARLCDNEFSKTEEEYINSSGYVVHTLESCIWCLLNSSGYKETVLKAVNLGNDTDTIAALAGGLAGIYYGYGSIPPEWISNTARLNDILDLCDRFYDSII